MPPTRDEIAAMTDEQLRALSAEVFHETRRRRQIDARRREHRPDTIPHANRPTDTLEDTPDD